MTDRQKDNVKVITDAASSLARIFARLRKHGKLVLAPGTPHENPQAQIVVWLNDRYADFVTNLLSLLRSENDNLQVHYLGSRL